jgi:serine phosphatase RsbU (regulator of sigma subunit)
LSDADEQPCARRDRTATRGVLWLPVATLVAGLLVTVVLAAVSQAQYSNNEKRLLRLRVSDAAALIAGSLPSIQTPLASAAELADATNGNVQKFMRFVAQYIGTGTGEFVSISLWSVAAPARGPVAVEGAPYKLSTADSPAFFTRVARTPELSVTGLLTPPDLRVGYAFATPGVPDGYAAYGERALPADRRSRFENSSQFAGLDYALYLGIGTPPQDLLVTNVSAPPPRGLTDTEIVPFGDSSLTLVMSSRQPLTGSLPERLPWIIAVVGSLLAAGAAAGTLLLIERRRDAERLAGSLEASASENQRLYTEQRMIAQTLQHALLPDRLPQIPGVQTSARYEAGERGVEIGGDWYDVIHLDDRRLLLVVGDVSGRGLRAATTMASLRYAIHAYAAQNDSPPEILTKLSHLVSVADSGQLATILCTLVDIERREITVTSAGHLPPLLISNGDGRYVESEVGLPIGVEAGATYTSTTVSAPDAGTLVAFTDGLVEHRGENLDDGLARLRGAAVCQNTSLPQLLGNLVAELRYGPAEDDIAIVALRWTA